MQLSKSVTTWFDTYLANNQHNPYLPMADLQMAAILEILHAMHTGLQSKDPKIHQLNQMVQYSLFVVEFLQSWESDFDINSMSEDEALRLTSWMTLWITIARWLYLQRPIIALTESISDSFSDMDCTTVPTELLQTPFDSLYIHLEKPLEVDSSMSDVIGFYVSHRHEGSDLFRGLAYFDDKEYNRHLQIITLHACGNYNEFAWLLNKETIGEGSPHQQINKVQLLNLTRETSLDHADWMEKSCNLVINTLLYINASNATIRKESNWETWHNRFQQLWDAQKRHHSGKTRKARRKAERDIQNHKRKIKKYNGGTIFWLGESQTQSADGDGTCTMPVEHWRRAHWHSYRIGKRKALDGSEIPKEKRKLRLKYLAPIKVTGRLPEEDDNTDERPIYGVRYPDQEAS